MKFAPTLRRLAVVLVLTFSFAWMVSATPASADVAYAKIISVHRTAANPNVVVVTGDNHVKSGYDILYPMGITMPGVKYDEIFAGFSRNTAGTFQVEVTFHDLENHPVKLPLSAQHILWGSLNGVTTIDKGQLTLNAVAPSNSDSPTTTTTTNPVTVSVNVTMGGILKDQVTGSFPAKALSTKLQGSNLLSVSGTASLVNNRGTVTWKLSRASATKPWIGHLMVADRAMNIVSSFARTLSVSRAKTGQLTGSATAKVTRDGELATATLHWSIAAPG